MGSLNLPVSKHKDSPSRWLIKERPKHKGSPSRWPVKEYVKQMYLCPNTRVFQADGQSRSAQTQGFTKQMANQGVCVIMYLFPNTRVHQADGQSRSMCYNVPVSKHKGSPSRWPVKERPNTRVLQADGQSRNAQTQGFSKQMANQGTPKHKGSPSRWPIKERPNTRVHPADGQSRGAQTQGFTKQMANQGVGGINVPNCSVVHAATLGAKSQIKLVIILAIRPSHSLLTPGQPVLTLTQLQSTETRPTSPYTLTQLQSTDTRPTSPSTDPMPPGDWQGPQHSTS